MTAKEKEKFEALQEEIRDLKEKNAALVEEVDRSELEEKSGKTFGCTDTNATKDNVSDLVVWGKGDVFKLISKASSQSEGWMKSTKAMQIDGLGCVLQVTTQQGEQVAEALQFIPGVIIYEEKNEEGVVIARTIKKQ